MEEIRVWRNDVMTHTRTVETIVHDRVILKSCIEEHLKQFFNWDKIEYDRIFNKITLKWSKENNPIIRHDKIHELGMDWEIRTDYDDEAFGIVAIDVYPFGFEGIGD